MRQAKDAATILDTKHESAEEVRYRIQHAGQAASAANNEAQMAYDKANQARNMSMSEVNRVTVVQRSIDEFQRSGPPTPEDVKALAEEVRFNTAYAAFINQSSSITIFSTNHSCYNC